MSEQLVMLQEEPQAKLLEQMSEKNGNVTVSNPGMYKCLLNQYAQKSSIQPPVYQTLNEGSQHQPQFRSHVWIDGACYTSPNTFSQRKAAEMEASKIAFFTIMQKKKDAGTNLIREGTSLCKSILIEYTVRMNLEKPSYQTTQPDLLLPLFFSKLIFNGMTYTGEFARNKIEAERLAARAAILSILDTGSEIMSEIINSKLKCGVAPNKAKSSLNVQVSIKPESVHSGNDNGLQLNTANELEVAGTNNIPIPSTILAPHERQIASIPTTNLPLQVIHSPKPEVQTNMTSSVIPVAPILEPNPLLGSTTAAVPLNIVSPPIVEQAQLGASTSGKKRKRKNKKKAQNASIPMTDLILPVIQPLTPEVQTKLTTSTLSAAPILEQNPMAASSTDVVTPLRTVGPPVSEQIPLVSSSSRQKRNRKNKKKAQVQA